MTKKPQPPRKPTTIDKLMNDLVAGRETPALLGFQAGMERAMRPAAEAVSRLVEAIAADLRQPTDETRLEVERAKVGYEVVVEQSALVIWDDLVEQAKTHNLERRKRPPAMSEILDIEAEPSDLGYSLGGTLGGVQGTWHRLWSSISSARFFEFVGAPQDPQHIEEMRAEFEGLFGRALTEAEWHRLVQHAHLHADEVLMPTMAKHLPEN